MALKQEIIELMTVTRTANATLTANRLVKPDADPANVVVCTANARPLGLVDVSAVAGDPVKVIVQGLAQIEVGAAGVTQDGAVISDAAGRVVDAGASGDQNIVGYALHTKTSGQLASVLLFPTCKYAEPSGGGVGDAAFVIGAEALNVINVAIQLKDAYGADLAVRGSIPFYLSDDANGDSIAAAAPDAGIAIGTDGLMIEWTANLAGILTSESDGDIDIDLEHAAGAKTVYLVLILPNGTLKVSGAITFA